MKKNYISILFFFLFLQTNAQWQATNGLSTGTVYCFDTTLTCIYAGTNHGVYVSNNDGFSWSSMNNGLPAEAVATLLTKDSIIYAGTFAGVYISKNNGQNWTQISTGLPTYNGRATYINGLVKSGNNLIAGSNGNNPGIYWSNNNGANWTSAPYLANILSLSNFGVYVLAGTNSSGVLLSIDDGLSWSLVNKGLPQYTTVFSFAYVGTKVFIGTDRGVYYSNDSCKNWSSANNGLPSVRILSLKAINAKIFAGANDGKVYCSTNNGASWVSSSSGLADLANNALCIKKSKIFVGKNDNGVYASNDNGGAWTGSYNGLLTTITKTYVNNLAVNGSDILASADGATTGNKPNGLFISKNGGASWVTLFDSAYSGVRSVAVSGADFFLGTSANVYFSSNSGRDWKRASNGLSTNSLYNSVNSLYANGSVAFASTGAGTYRSVDKGNNWVPINPASYYNKIVSNNGQLYAGSAAGVYNSIDNGLTWMDINGSSEMDTLTVSCFAFEGTDIFVGANLSGGCFTNACSGFKGVFYSNNNGVSWTKMNNGLPSNISKVKSIKVDGRNVFIGTENDGVFLSTDYGNSWVSFNSGFEYSHVKTINSLVILGSTIYAGTDVYGVYSRPLSDVVCDAPIITANHSLTLCNGASVILTSSPANSYLWSTGANTKSITVSTSGNYSVTVQNSKGCSSTGAIKIVSSSTSFFSQTVYRCPGKSLTIGSHTYTVAGKYKDTITSSYGCDSIVSTDLIYKGKATNRTINVTACDKYVFPSGKYTRTYSGTFYDTIQNAAGCDSLMTINLTIKKSSSKTINIVTCEKYISPSGIALRTSGTYKDTIRNKAGCDSLITINLTIKKSSYKTINVVACDKYVSPNGTVLRVTGKYKDTLRNAVHCDSVITINLTIKNSSVQLINATACNQYISPSGKIWKISKTYKDTIRNKVGCDSIITINLTIKKSSSKTINPIVCTQYVSPSGKHIWKTSGTYKDTIRNKAGCDSLLTINLTIKKSTSATFSVSACNKYVSPSRKHVWRTSGTYKDTIRNAAGCDSLLTIKLTVTTLNITVAKSGEMLTSNAVGATYQWLDCRNNFAEINGATSRSFKPSATGTYAVALSDNGCADTSGCVYVKVTCYSHFTTTYNRLKNSFKLSADTSTIGFASTYQWNFGDGTTSTSAIPPVHVYAKDTVYKACLKIKTASGETCSYCNIIGKDKQGNIYKSNDFNEMDSETQLSEEALNTENNFVIFPNPTSGEAEIMLTQAVNNASVKVVNITGQKVLEKSNISGNHVSIDISNQPQGIYFIEILSNGNVWRGKLVKE